MADPPGSRDKDPGSPREVIDLCTPTLGDKDSYMPEQVAGAKRRKEEDGDGAQTTDSDSSKRRPSATDCTTTISTTTNDNHEEEAKTEAGETPPVTDGEEMKQDENTDGSDNPSTFDDNVAETLNYTEMYNYLHAELRKLTAAETKIIKGLVEGTILCSKLSDFLKRICTNEALRRIQNTIQVQVEGDLVLKLHANFPVL
ncbi:hypothetical protein BBJ29_009502 [Phytophthora kernoviae]|uniref:Uncharacterized protein n=1 Tax=Phytophthora kernoviae TaxID=325452 RepID=A0A3F2RJB2_9STRA|nr:hypothetical protein BBP00_00007082 [Phytophthora kernoviae]RLN62441.1 hypothetical protein BBJ29_009502 [Phytophthora kernoviae]